MAGQVHHSAQESDQVVNDFIDAITAIRTTIGRIGDDIEASKAGWQGDASGRCQTAVSDWGGEAADLNQKLQILSDTVSAGNQTLTLADQSNVDGFTNL